MHPTTHPAIEDHLDAVTHRACNLGQHFTRGRRMIQLTTTAVPILSVSYRPPLSRPAISLCRSARLGNVSEWMDWARRVRGVAVSRASRG
jgi:hypothetical protein